VRRLAAAAGALAGLSLALGAALLLLREPPAAPPPPKGAAAAPAPRGNRRASRPAPAPPPEPVPAPEAPPAADPDEEEEAREEAAAWRRYPEGAVGPVVVGVVTAHGDPDPDCWVALESVDEPGRPDPSGLESRSGGRFRLTGLKAGRYRVRVKLDDTPAAYSGVIEARDGEVADAGHLRLLRRGCVSGLLRDAGGRECDAEVRLFGRDPGSLAARIVERVPSVGR